MHFRCILFNTFCYLIFLLFKCFYLIFVSVKNVYCVFPDDLASKANIIIDPAEIQAASMDDLDEDDETGAAQVQATRDFTA